MEGVSRTHPAYLKRAANYHGHGGRLRSSVRGTRTFQTALASVLAPLRITWLEKRSISSNCGLN